MNNSVKNPKVTFFEDYKEFSWVEFPLYPEIYFLVYTFFSFSIPEWIFSTS